MARKENITIGLPKPVLDAIEQAQIELYRKSLNAQVRGDAGDAKFSRSMTIEMLIIDGLRKHGFDVVWGTLKDAETE
jgi:hypothetical protein